MSIIDKSKSKKAKQDSVKFKYDRRIAEDNMLQNQIEMQGYNNGLAQMGLTPLAPKQQDITRFDNNRPMQNEVDSEFGYGNRLANSYNPNKQTSLV